MIEYRGFHIADGDMDGFRIWEFGYYFDECVYIAESEDAARSWIDHYHKRLNHTPAAFSLKNPLTSGPGYGSLTVRGVSRVVPKP